MNNEIKALIAEKFRTESECARTIGWSRQRLNKITTGAREPSIYELNELAKVLGKSTGLLVPIFLSMQSPNGQRID